MPAINITREWFVPQENDGNLDFANIEDRIAQAILALGPGDWIELEDGTPCHTEEDLRNALHIGQ